MTDEECMRHALEKAENAMVAGEPPFGAVLYSGRGLLLAAGYDTVRLSGDSTRHAEIETVRGALRESASEVPGSTLFTTVEPCPMCFTSAWLGGVARIVFGASMQDVFAVVGRRQRELSIPASTINQGSPEPILLTGGILRRECLALFRRPEAYRDVPG